jgi:hypothetical protein
MQNHEELTKIVNSWVNPHEFTKKALIFHKNTCEPLNPRLLRDLGISNSDMSEVLIQISDEN